MLNQSAEECNRRCDCVKHAAAGHTQKTKADTVPECVYTVDAAWHVLSVIYVCGFRVEDLKHRREQ